MCCMMIKMKGKTIHNILGCHIMITQIYTFVYILAICSGCDNPTFTLNNNKSINCDVLTQIDSGWVCGRIRTAEEDVKYASFRGIPYAQQPVGALRFKELQLLAGWSDVLDASEEGPICPQYDELYGHMARSVGMNEACIFANVHVPLSGSDLKSKETCQNTSLPILVFVHGGGFQSGSGNADLHGPEYLVSKGVIVITFNYRINIFGYLSLNSASIPGNNGLRDAITLLKWVQKNARAFGGDPGNVTLGGQSCGSVAAHLISLSEASKGLYKRVLLMSGLGHGDFYTNSPAYAKTLADILLEYVGINSTDADEIHKQLVQMPLEKLMEANRVIQSKTGLVSFVPVVESIHPGVTRILDGYPADLITRGRGKDLPMIVGTTSKECEYFKRRLTYLNLIEQIKESPSLILPPNITYFISETEALHLSHMVIDRYFGNEATVDKYLIYCTNTYFIYPAFKLAEWRASMEAAPLYMYQFSFDSDFNLIKLSRHLEHLGGGSHIEDQTFMLRVNSLLDPNEQSFPPRSRDDLMKHWMTTFVVNFMRCSDPVCDEPSKWPATDADRLNYQMISDPVFIFNNVNMTAAQREMFKFHDNIHATAREVIDSNQV